MKKIILSAVILLTFGAIGCNSNGGDPKGVLMSFFDALGKKDIEGAKKYATKDSEAMLGMMQMGMSMAPKDTKEPLYDKNNMEYGEAKIEGDKATVPVKDKKSGETTNYALKKEGGSWKVAFDKSTLMEMAQKKMKEHGLNNQIDGSIDSLHEKMKSLSKEDMEHAKKMMDSVKELMNK